MTSIKIYDLSAMGLGATSLAVSAWEGSSLDMEEKSVTTLLTENKLSQSS